MNRLGFGKDTPDENPITPHLCLRRKSSRYRGWVDCTIDTNGARLRSADLVANVVGPEALNVLDFRSSSAQLT